MNFRILFCILVTTASHAQNNTLDSLYQQVSEVALTSNPPLTLAHLLQLEQSSITHKEQIEIYLLRASLLRQYGNRDQAIATLKKADSLVGKHKFPNLQARIQGALSTLYRENGIETLGKLSLTKAKYWSKYVDNQLELSVLKGNLLQEQAYYNMNATRYKEAIQCLKDGRAEFATIEPKLRFFHLASTDQLIAENYIQLKDEEQAIRLLNAALTELQQSTYPESPLKGFIYNSLGMAHLLGQDYETSFSYFTRAQQVGEQSGFVELQKQALASLIEHAKQVGNTQQYLLYNEQYMQLIEQQLSVQKKVADVLVGAYYEKEGAVKTAYHNYVWYSLSIGSGIVLFISLFYFRKRKYEQEMEVNTLPNAESPPPVQQEDVVLKLPPTSIDHGYIAKETADLILKGMQQFEENREFLKHEISLSKLASQIGVNHRYLSYVIKHHKQQDFSSYINTLRIDYIVMLLQNNPETLKYKISYLANLCGFASHSRFTITFKRIKGISPSAFIENLQEKS